ncbi:MAG: collagenase [Pseudomonadota bacterium]
MKQRQWAVTKLTAAMLLSGWSLAAQAQQPCQYQDLVASPQWVTQVANADSSCYASWFNAPTEAAHNLYSEASLTPLVNSLTQAVTDYRGESQQAQRIANMSELLKAAYYARYATRDQHGYFSSDFSRTIAQVSLQFIRSPHAKLQGREQVQAMSSMTLLVDSVKQLPVTLEAMLTLLETFDRSNSENLQYVDGLNNLFRAMSGHVARDEFYAALVSNPSYLNRLQRFVDNNIWAMGSDAEFLVYNAVRETGRLLAGRNTQLNQQVMPFLERILSRYPLGSEQEKLWIGAAEMVAHYAPDKARQLNIAASKAQLEQRLLAHRFECNGPAIIRSQNLTDQQAEQACQILNEQEQHFHQVVNSGQVPVADDVNNRVEVVVWQDNAAYTTYSNFLFGNSTDNGGQYLEGDPSAQSNIARFLAYRYASDELAILNLEHEYVHYLDGRFNLYGGFNQTLSEGHIVWWLEGFAEYMHYQKDYQAALDLIGSQNLSLSEVFATNYLHDVNRIYRWGYLAVRFMFEQHPSEVERLLLLARRGDYSAWAREVKALGFALDQEFSAWLEEVAQPVSGDKDTDQGEKPETDSHQSFALNQTQSFAATAYQERLFYVDVPEGTEQFQVSITGDGDADLYASYQQVAHYYDFQISEYQQGSEEVIVFKPQANGLIAPGRYYFSLTAREAFNEVEVTTYAKNKHAVHSDERTPIVLENSQAKAFSIDNVRYAGLYVSQPGTVRVWLKGLQPQQAPVEMFVGLTGWASKQQFDLSTQGQGESQYLEFDVERAGYVHFTISAQQTGSMVEFFAAY